MNWIKIEDGAEMPERLDQLIFWLDDGCRLGFYCDTTDTWRLESNNKRVLPEYYSIVEPPKQ